MESNVLQIGDIVKIDNKEESIALILDIKVIHCISSIECVMLVSDGTQSRWMFYPERDEILSRCAK